MGRQVEPVKEALTSSSVVVKVALPLNSYSLSVGPSLEERL